MRRRAMSLLGDEMMEASVERMQALFLLAVSDFGEGNGGRSWLLTGMAIRMAAAMRLHRESTYSLTPTSTPEDAIRSEMTRRSFWLIYCHDQQIAGRSPSTTFPLSTIDVLLPGEEEDFIFGQTPAAGRSVLPGSLAAGSSLTHALEPHRSIFASMIIGQWLWARTAEQASGLMDPHDVRPWDENEQFWQLDRELQLWEMNLPARHTFNAFTLRVMKGQHLDLAFLSISMLLRLSHIVLRRAYLPWMASAVDESSSPPLDPDTPPNFWEGMALHMVQNCINLHQITQTGVATRSMEDGFPAVFIFGVYMCGDIAYYLNRWPKLCPKHAHHAPEMLNSSLQLLEQLEAVWPLATRWRTTLARLVHASPTETTFRHAARASRNADEEEGIYRDPSTRSTGSTAYKATSPISATSTPQTISEEARTSTSTSGLTSSLSAPNVDINHFSALNAALNQSSLTLGSAQSPSRVPTPQPRLQSQSQNISTPLAFDLFSFDSLNPGNLFSDVNAHGQGQNGYGPGSTVDFGDGTSVLDYDGFGADLTAFLRGEPTD
ncbi:hypothetical protein I316_06163 [Kwoniella heveanensis BCC8398]|uniref:Xylanolytic transcriptional activator regulatory domain-containing protein n=1 Tax=Kwoniella heveanensis BCC8398 TaxID=1296120 RepID=A0A1B9GMK6_9TREE|nr:hypothetical protein I316_06163 [Kwoniella heveanensis BCC8398]